MGERPADPALIPDFSLLDPDSDRLVSKRDWILMEAGYRLITDNLLDLSHTAVIHEGILGSEYTIRADLTVTQQRNQILVARSLPNVPVPGLYDLLFRRDGGPVDLWMNMRWDAPGCLLNDTGSPRQALRETGTGFWGTLSSRRDRGDHLLSVRRRALQSDLVGRAAGQRDPPADICPAPHRVRGSGPGNHQGTAAEYPKGALSVEARAVRHRCWAGALQAHSRCDDPPGNAAVRLLV